MKKCLAVLAMLSIALGISGQAFSQSASSVEDLSKPAGVEPPMLGIHWARGFQPNFRVGELRQNRERRTSPNMTYHGGKIMPTAVTASIFWGPSWSNSGFVNDKINGLAIWYTGFSNSNYAVASDEYTGTNGQVGPATSYAGAVLDFSPASGGNGTSAILAEVCHAIPSPDPTGNGYYAVYTDIPRGNSNYCAYHSSGSCGGVPVQFAFFWNLDNDPGCDPRDKSGLHSEGLAALANVGGHELSEARTDPASPGAWYDSSGQENGDKCAWTFGAPLVSFSDGSQWKIQGEWSNAAYKAGTGYPNRLGQRGCLSGQ